MGSSADTMEPAAGHDPGATAGGAGAGNGPLDGPVPGPMLWRHRAGRARLWLWLAAIVALPVAGLVAYLSFLQYTGNYHPVVAGEAYRAAQFDGAGLESFVRRDGIRSVLNLRGPSPGEAWYREEIAASARLGLTHADFAMSASTELTAEEARRLIALMKSLPKPILIHCRGGSDRTGLASALYLAAIAGKDERTAEAQLSIRYGHFAVPLLSAAWPMYATWERMERELGFPNS